VGTEVFLQLRTLVTALAAGGALGLLRDLLALLPGRGGAGMVREGLFAAAALWLLFTLGLRTGEGLRPGFLCAAGGGICFYFSLLHPMVSASRKAVKQFLRIKHF